MTKTIKLTGVTGHDLKVLGGTQIMEDDLGSVDVIVVADISHAMILGRDVLRRDGADIDYALGHLIWRGHTLKMLPNEAGCYIASLGDRPPLMGRKEIELCVEENEDLFAAKGEHLGCHPDIAVRIDTEGPPIKRRAYRLPLSKRAALDRKLDELLEQGVIVESSSPWASPVVLVEKKDPSDGPRFTVDFTHLNKVTRKDAYPIPLIRDIFDQLQGATIFSTLDLKSGFHQLPLYGPHQEKTAFVCHRGLYEWTRLPMGLCNASQGFQRAMEVVLKGLIGKTCLLYIDDVVVYSRNPEDHVEHLRTLFQRLRDYNLRLNPAKCVFGMKEVKLLGYLVSEKGLRADPDKVQAIVNLQPPKDLGEARSFLGMTGYYRTCIQDYAQIAGPLVQLTKKNFKFKWNEECQRAFDTLKSALISDHVMAHPQPSKPYFLYTDACDYAVGAILCQHDDNGVERPIVYLSKQLSDSQRRWATIEKEAYGVVYALKQLRPYLWGAQYRTFTDHKPLTSLFTKDMNNTKIQRWAVLLAEYNCKVEYHKGKLNIRADMLSRIRHQEGVNTFDTEFWHLGEALPELPPDVTIPELYDLDLAHLKQQQKQMTEWTEHTNEDSDYQLINGLLYSTRCPHRYAAEYPRLVLPAQQRQKVILRAHQDVGHMATLKTMRHLQDVFVWPNMKREIDTCLAKCPTCIAHSKVQPRAPMGEMPVAKAPMQIVAADLIGPLIQSTGGHKYILTVVDHCSGWAEAYPLKTKTSTEVWQRLSREFLPRHAYPHVLITDRGLEFGAQSLRQYLKDLGIDHRRTTGYNPQANGKCERLNGTLKQIIARLVNNKRSDWEDKLGPALLAYNNSVSVTTGHTPYFLMYGRRARLPLSRLLPVQEGLDDRLHDVAAALRSAAQATVASRIHNRNRLAQQATTGVLKVGDS